MKLVTPGGGRYMPPGVIEVTGMPITTEPPPGGRDVPAVGRKGEKCPLGAGSGGSGYVLGGNRDKRGAARAARPR